MMEKAPEQLCPGCFAAKGNQNPCPHCGYDEQAPRGPLVLHHRELLNAQYLVGRVLGKPGGFGITYLGWDLKLQTRVAIKEYLPRDLAGRGTDQSTVAAHSGEDAELFRFGLEQFLREARTLAQLDHPNIVRVRQFFEANETAYLVMDYYDGLSLEEYLEQQGGRIQEEAAIQLMLPILDGLRAVHAKGFLHRDVKPQNIYLAKTDTGGVRPILLDFGAARQAMGERSRSMSVVVSAGYAPFEQYHRKGKQGPWTDIYSVAAVLYRAVTGSVPLDAAERQAHDDLQRATAYGISLKLSQCLAKALSIVPDERPRSIQSFQTALRDGSAAMTNGTSRQEESNAKDALASSGSSGSDKILNFKPSKLVSSRHAIIFATLLFAAVVSILALSFRQELSEEFTSLRLEKAADAYAEGDYESAYSIVSQLAQKDNPDAISLLSEMYYYGDVVEKNLPEAIKLKRKAYELGLLDEAGPLGWFLILSGNFAEGRYYSEIAYERDPAGYPWIINLGHTHFLQGDSDNARSWYEKAIPMIPDEDTLLNNALVDFDIFIENGWNREASIKEKTWMRTFWYKKAAEKGDSAAQNGLGLMYDEGVGVPMNDAEAVKWYLKAAEQGHPIAQFNLAQMYEHGEGTPKSQADADHWYKQSLLSFKTLAAEGNASAENMVGEMYLEGLGVNKDVGKALQWFRKAADKGSPEAQLNIGYIYDLGLVGVEDDLEAVRWYRKAADQEYPEAENMLGRMYQEGEGVEQDMSAAVSWFRKAAEKNLAVAQYNLGLCYQEGSGVEADSESAVDWYRKAAEQGIPNAENMLGRMYQEGEGVEQDLFEAVSWFRKAAEKDFAYAQYNLGLSYQDGLGVDKDIDKAIYWYRKSANNGDEDAAAALDAFNDDQNIWK
ncbi:protein kinase [Thiohalocapsa marina]|uniref:Protein kinase n=1 Tax=Thiohalocapsa marina TaxID=424902 RepID=A0A5M8FCT8_9GAMM|nr:serine/threonine-protein kinase [Thiohalocapsa marina]KAA6182479.1 protein kinase [Thiohalocapsa marina]